MVVRNKTLKTCCSITIFGVSFVNNYIYYGKILFCVFLLFVFVIVSILKIYPNIIQRKWKRIIVFVQMVITFRSTKAIAIYRHEQHKISCVCSLEPSSIYIVCQTIYHIYIYICLYLSFQKHLFENTSKFIINKYPMHRMIIHIVC